MDSGPICRRTRLRKDQYFRELWEKIKKEEEEKTKKNNNNEVSDSDRGIKLVSVKDDELNRVDEFKVLNSLDSESCSVSVSDDDSEEFGSVLKKSIQKRNRSKVGSRDHEKRLKLGTKSGSCSFHETDSVSDCGSHLNVIVCNSNSSERSIKELEIEKIVNKEINYVQKGNFIELKSPTKRMRNSDRSNNVTKSLRSNKVTKSVKNFISENPTSDERKPKFESSIPLKFSFGVEQSKLPEKSESELGEEKLWNDCDFAVRADEIDIEVDTMAEDDFIAENEADRATLCYRGKHDLFLLDEETGLVCKHCPYVKEMKYILPRFDNHPFGRSDAKDCIYSSDDHQSMFSELHYQDFACDSYSGSGSCSLGKGTVWDVIPHMQKNLYPHQREGFEFIWKNIGGGIHLDKLKNKSSSNNRKGCIVCHAPGTGKTRLTVFFVLSYMQFYPNCKPLVIAPRSMLLTWKEEFRKWKTEVPFHILNSNDLIESDIEKAKLLLKEESKCHYGRVSTRKLKLVLWKYDRSRSILGVSYRLFSKLVGVQKGANNAEVRKLLLELPDLVVFDEGHTARNADSLIWKALANIITERRILLSGTPFQNNFDELFNTLSLVRPKFAEKFMSRASYNKHASRRNKVKEQWTSLTNPIGKPIDDEDHKLRELRALIEPFVHIHKGTVLQERLPGLRNFLVTLNPTLPQKELLESIQVKRPSLEMEYIESLISVHPSLLLKNDKKVPSVNSEHLERLRLNPDAGIKTKFLMKLIRLSEAINEKVLVFSQYLEPLSLLRDQLKTQLNWNLDKEILCMDGHVPEKQRQSLMDVFNNPFSEVKVLLASTKACGEGINLVGASRVVLLDVVWNPSVEWQAICRAYRLGQRKVVHVYHLFTSGTKEEEKYSRQGEKYRLSKLVFSSSECNENQQEVPPSVAIEDRILEEMIQHQKLKDMFERVAIKQRESNSVETFSLL